MRRAIKWVLILALIAGYSYIVASWWIEGTNNFEQQRQETCAEHRRDATPLENLPQGCRQ